MTYLEFKEKYSNRIRNDIKIEELKKEAMASKANLEELMSEESVKEYLSTLNKISVLSDKIDEEKTKKDEDAYKEYYQIINCQHLFVDYGFDEEKYCLRCGRYEYDIIDINSMFRSKKDTNYDIIKIGKYDADISRSMLRDISKKILENNLDIDNEELANCIYNEYQEIKSKSDESYYSNHRIKKFVRNIKKQLKK